MGLLSRNNVPLGSREARNNNNTKLLESFEANKTEYYFLNGRNFGTKIKLLLCKNIRYDIM